MSEASRHTRESLLDSAITLFSAKGYVSVGIREIAEAAGANIASIKYHFGSKRDLYLAAVERVMGRHEADNAWDLLAAVPDEPRAAALALVRFVRRFLRHLMPSGSDVETCSSLMIREALMPSEAFETIVDEFLTPNNELLTRVIGELVPDADQRLREHLAGALLGQVLHVRVFHPFVERLRGVDLSDPEEVDDIAFHIAEFSLRGMGLNDVFIIETLEAARADDVEPVKGRTP